MPGLGASCQAWRKICKVSQCLQFQNMKNNFLPCCQGRTEGKELNRLPRPQGQQQASVPLVPLQDKPFPFLLLGVKTFWKYDVKGYLLVCYHGSVCPLRNKHDTEENSHCTQRCALAETDLDVGFRHRVRPEAVSEDLVVSKNFQEETFLSAFGHPSWWLSLT